MTRLTLPSRCLDLESVNTSCCILFFAPYRAIDNMFGKIITLFAAVAAVNAEGHAKSVCDFTALAG
jgi:hypothetical protein